MIIECINCNKKFNVNSELIPDNGREIQCGSCKHIWFFKKEKQINETPTFKEDISKDVVNEKVSNNKNDKIIEIEKSEVKSNFKKSEDKLEKKISNDKQNKKENKIVSKFFSYLIVLVISFIALVILVDTVKIPLINIFPGLKMILFNLFETLHDIKLFIIDLY